MRNKKKIIRACTVPQSIGFFEEVIVKMKKDGYESVVVTSPEKELFEFQERHPEFKTISVPMERHISLVQDIISLIRMIRVFMKERPYVVHSMTPKAGLLCMVAGWLTGVPVRIHTFTGLVWPTAVGTKRKILMLTDKILCACATHIIPEGEGVKNDLQTYITKKPMKVLGYGNCRGVDMERFNPDRFKGIRAESLELRETFTYLFVGRIVGDKGINELVEAFTKLHDKYGNTKLTLVGEYEKELDPVSELTQQRIEANSAIETPGAKSGDDLVREYMKADCFVFPSYREGFPNTPLEAGAMGLPCIVTDINGSREIISTTYTTDEHGCGSEQEESVKSVESVVDNETTTDRTDDNGKISVKSVESVVDKLKICDNGIVIPSKDVDALYEAMELMLTDKQAYDRMKVNARPMIAERFEKSFVQGCQIQFYKEIMR